VQFEQLGVWYRDARASERPELTALTVELLARCEADRAERNARVLERPGDGRCARHEQVSDATVPRSVEDEVSHIVIDVAQDDRSVGGW
jgi:hypothetical protein